MSVLTPRRLYTLNAKNKYSKSRQAKAWKGPKAFYDSPNTGIAYTDLNSTEPPSPQEIHYYQMKAMGALYLGQKMDIQKYLPELNDIMQNNVTLNPVEEEDKIMNIINETFGLWTDDKSKITLHNFTEKSKIIQGAELLNEYNKLIEKIKQMIIAIKTSNNGFIEDKDLSKNMQNFENRINLIETNINTLVQGSEISYLNSKNKNMQGNITNLFRGLISYGDSLKGRYAELMAKEKIIRLTENLELEVADTANLTNEIHMGGTTKKKPISDLVLFKYKNKNITFEQYCENIEQTAKELNNTNLLRMTYDEDPMAVKIGIQVKSGLNQNPFNTKPISFNTVVENSGHNTPLFLLNRLLNEPGASYSMYQTDNRPNDYDAIYEPYFNYYLAKSLNIVIGKLNGIIYNPNAGGFMFMDDYLEYLWNITGKYVGAKKGSVNIRTGKMITIGMRVAK